MIQIRKANDRGKTELGWLHSQHTFSFGGFYDPRHMGFRALRVINDDTVEPGKGFGTHGHEDAEIFSYVLEGELEHKDSMGNGSVIKAGNLQYMSAGDGVTHSEFNPSKSQRVHFLQIWLLPNQRGGKPIYDEKELGALLSDNGLTLLFSGTPHNGAIGIRQDANVYLGKLAAGKSLKIDVRQGRAAWIQLIRGTIEVIGNPLNPGDGAALSDIDAFDIRAENDAEFLLFDLS
jgi:redox-sensitive bicupin YhaK (pirin superfamily)